MLGGTLAMGTAAQAPSDREHFYGGGPRYGTTHSNYSNPYPSAFPGLYQSRYSNPYASASPVHVLGGGQALRYGIGVGRVGFTRAGVTKISAKREWPGWTPPADILRRRPDLPRHMNGGIDNPLGARAMYLGSSLYRIHGSNEPGTIGQAVSAGCFRMTRGRRRPLQSGEHRRPGGGAAVNV